MLVRESLPAKQGLFLCIYRFCLYVDICSQVRIGKLTQYSITYLRHLRDFFGVYFRLKPDPNTSTVSQFVECEALAPLLLIGILPIPSLRNITYFPSLPSPKVMLSCQGIGFKNLSRGAT